MGVWKHNKVLTEEFLSQPDILKLSNKELSDRLGIEKTVVGYYRRKLHVEAEHSLKIQRGKLLRTIPIPDWQLGIIVGTLFGDASLYKSECGRISLRVAHCDKQREYIELKRCLLDNICVSNIYSWSDRKMGGLYHKVTTISDHPDIRKLYDMFYQGGRKVVTQQALDLLTVAGLVMWVYDDGYRSSNSYTLSTCSFTLEENKLIRKHLFKKFGIKTTPIRVSNGKARYWSLHFAKDTVPILQKYLESYYLPCFAYKIDPKSLCSSETARKALWNYFPKVKIQSELYSDIQSVAEMSTP